MATGSTDGVVEGINDVQRAEQTQFGPGEYRPVVPVTYWTFRLMIGFGVLAALVALAGLWSTRGTRIPGRGFARVALLAMALPLLANSFGWIFTEMGRQPWVVYGQLRTADGVSPSVGVGTVLTSLIVFTLLYGVLAVVEGYLLIRTVKAGPAPAPAPEAVSPRSDDAERPFAVAY
jgi:cytochrome d ubiquinol oxidase subunit I